MKRIYCNILCTLKKYIEKKAFNNEISKLNFMLKKIIQTIISLVYLVLIFVILDEFIRSINLFPLEFVCRRLTPESCKTQILGNITSIIFLLPWVYLLIRSWRSDINWLFIFVHTFYFVFNILVLANIDDATMLIIPEFKSIVCYHGID